MELERDPGAVWNLKRHVFGKRVGKQPPGPRDADGDV